ncbi:fumarylacetoacetate hydrolase family protein [Herbaspirillum sp. GCM10030257]|uniref:fumarylacetoacetate hydrolase family protein n=1 Tax=Herbaspirillum sp. GCM10030257 TaxID=3273393 RepID=UPI003620904F
MRFIAFQNSVGKAALGVRVNTELVDISAHGLPSDLEEFLLLGEGAIEAARRIVASSAARLPLAGLTYLPPVANPRKALAIGLNYRDHAAESNFEPPKYPVIFSRFPSSWVGHDTPIICPKVSSQLDYEAELVVVIGKAGRYIARDKALDHVAGYSLFNDGSIRDYQLRTPQWTLGKNFDASGAFGPEFVTVDELPSGAKGLKLTCRLNDKVVQQANTSEMIFDVPSLISICSEAMALHPGDIIISGTPAGVGLARTPQLWMKAGDVCEVELEGLGILRNQIVNET